MKKIKVEIIKNNDIGLKKGTYKVLLPSVARSMIKAGYARKIEEIEVSKKQLSQDSLLLKIEDLEKRVAKLEKGKVEKPVKDEKSTDKKATDSKKEKEDKK